MILFEIVLIIFLLGFIFWIGSHLYSTVFYVPYVNSSDKAIHDALKLAELKNGQTLLDLGCGRGDALVIAARDFGANAIGYEISPFPFLLAKIRTLCNPKIKIYRRDLKSASLDVEKADAVYLYLLNSTLQKIENWFFDHTNDNAKIVALSFMFKKHTPIKTILTKNLGRTTNIYLYKK